MKRMNREEERWFPRSFACRWLGVLGLLTNIGANHFLITAAMQAPLSYSVSAMREDDTLLADEEALPLNV
jgi:hypothetical protein